MNRIVRAPSYAKWTSLSLICIARLTYNLNSADTTSQTKPKELLNNAHRFNII